MKVKPSRVAIPHDNPFENCNLGRSKHAEILRSIFESDTTGFVMSITSQWGTGKTTFIEMFNQYLRNNEFSTIYFNAWENDYDKNPLPAILSELKGLNPEKETDFKPILSKAATFFKGATPAVLKALAKHYGLDDIATAAVEGFSKASLELLSNEVDNHVKRKQSLIEFKKELSGYLEVINQNKPVVFFIDELDRCRPDYAVEVLEQVKHFFNVEGVIFVLSIDKEHLAAGIKGFYGSHEINTDEYLRRFIDWEYILPNPNKKEYINALFDKFALGDFFHQAVRMRSPAVKNDKQNFLATAYFLTETKNSTLRQIEKVFATVSLALRSFQENQLVIPPALYFLALIKITDSNKFQEISERRLSIGEFANYLAKEFLFPKEKSREFNQLYVIAVILQMYNDSYEIREPLVDSEGELSFDFSEIAKEHCNELARRLEGIRHEIFNSYTIGINQLTDRISSLMPPEN